MWTVSIFVSVDGAERISSYRGWCIASRLRRHFGAGVLFYNVLWMSTQSLSEGRLPMVIPDVCTFRFRPLPTSLPSFAQI